MRHDAIAVLDFGSQYTQLIARRVRECKVCCALFPRNASPENVLLLAVRSVGVMGDKRTYRKVIALRAVTTEDFMTADWARLDYSLLAGISGRIMNEVPGINRVVYDVASKPPAAIEWE